MIWFLAGAALLVWGLAVPRVSVVSGAVAAFIAGTVAAVGGSTPMSLGAFALVWGGGALLGQFLITRLQFNRAYAQGQDLSDLVGQVAVVTTPIDNSLNTGYISLGRREVAARSQEGEYLETGARVRVTGKRDFAVEVAREKE